MSNDETPFEILPPEEVEQLLPAYSQLSFLAKGGMAAVYRGLQTTLDRPVAIKILPSEFGANESFRLRFEAEGKAMARLNHPNLVGIFDFGQVDDLLFLIMEFVDGQTLHDYAHGSPIAELEALRLCQKVTEGLAHAHKHGILHRDIKPANVLINGLLEPKLGDFGLAHGEEREHGDNLNFGTPGYTAPEVMLGSAAADERSDLYAIGVMLYELLTATLPEAAYRPPSRVVQSDSRIDVVIAKAVQKEPSRRYASAEELAEALQNLIDEITSAPRRKLATATSPADASRTIAAAPVAAAALDLSYPSPDRAAAEQVPPATVIPPTRLQTKSSFLPFVRNLIIIAALCAAIFGVWRALEKKEARIAIKDAKSEKKLARQERKRDAERIRAEVERQSNLLTSRGTNTPSSVNPQLIPATPTPPSETVDDSPDPLAGLTPLEQLAELKPALLAGERDRFPDGALQWSSSHYFFIPEAMTWYEAIEFAENHGAHLAVTPSRSDLRWLSKEIPSGEGVWLGAGSTSRNDWAWFDESIAFELEPPRTTTKVAGMVTKFGIFKAGHPSEKLPFFIEWNNEGGAVGSRQKAFETIAETLASGDPIWPPGIRVYQDRRYLTVGRELSQKEAATIATRAGGTLAVPSDELEASFLRDYAAESGLTSLWVGGEKRDEAWSWQTNEGWNFTRWVEGHPLANTDASGLQINGTGWLSMDPYLDAPGFIIEWSKDAGTPSDIPGNAFSLAAEDPQKAGHSENIEELDELRLRATRFLEKEKKDFNARFKDNFTAQGMAMRQWLRNLPKEEAVEYETLYQDYSNIVNFNTYTLPDPDDTQLASSAEAASAILERHYRTQTQVNDKLEAAAEKLRISYLRRVANLLAEAKTQGLASEVEVLQNEIEACGQDGNSFLRHLGLL